MTDPPARRSSEAQATAGVYLVDAGLYSATAPESQVDTDSTDSRSMRSLPPQGEVGATSLRQSHSSVALGTLSSMRTPAGAGSGGGMHRSTSFEGQARATLPRGQQRSRTRSLSRDTHAPAYMSGETAAVISVSLVLVIGVAHMCGSIISSIQAAATPAWWALSRLTDPFFLAKALATGYVLVWLADALLGDEDEDADMLAAPARVLATLRKRGGRVASGAIAGTFLSRAGLRPRQ